MQSIYEYSDYRFFIRDYYERRKAENPAFSFRYLSRKAGINSAPFFKFLIDGKRNLTRESIPKVAAALRLDEKTGEYFKHLDFFNQAKSVKEKRAFRARLMELAGKDAAPDRVNHLNMGLFPLSRAPQKGGRS